ncbi:MAG: phosphatidylserine/phosphatidylglycerophosphate/cardiolipin synthase family protein [Verrucomicrobiales bacterium]|nr:phosphatidylserine/phosphatidylglycerophosphate/cardiolipin synthase family protein [Verrucomicrobiales bacterium]
MSAPQAPALKWLCTGQEIFPAMLDAIRSARVSIRLETYIYSDGDSGRQFLAGLLAAAQRGVRVSVLVDAFGSWELPDAFFAPLLAAGAKVHYFNPLRLWRFGVRDHRKLLVCDDSVVFIGGFNIADEYDGDGVTRGWCDLGARIENSPLAWELAASFDELFALADFRRKPLMRLRPFKRKRKSQPNLAGELLLSQPGRGASPFQAALHRDFVRARDIQIITAYFLPTRRVRRYLMHTARNGGRVQLILAGKSDVLISQMAARSLYHRLMKAGVEIYEYQPQILHAKMIVSDGITYVGSSNLDIRSLNLNYELMLRFADKTIAAGAQEIFERTLKHSRRIEHGTWLKSQTWWQRWQHRWARFMLARIDPFVALRQFRAVKK